MLIKEKVKSIFRKNNLIFYVLKEIYKFYNFTYLKFFAGTNKDIFTEIYVKNKWKDDSSHSGTGSNLEQTKEIIKFLPKFISKNNIQSILDIPCGDFYWMKEINFDKVNYIGGDINIQENQSLSMFPSQELVEINGSLQLYNNNSIEEENANSQIDRAF